VVRNGRMSTESLLHSTRIVVAHTIGVAPGIRRNAMQYPKEARIATEIGMCNFTLIAPLRTMGMATQEVPSDWFVKLIGGFLELRCAWNPFCRPAFHTAMCS
jgi:hypothetical protein